MKFKILSLTVLMILFGSSYAFSAPPSKEKDLVARLKEAHFASIDQSLQLIVRKKNIGELWTEMQPLLNDRFKSFLADKFSEIKTGAYAAQRESRSSVRISVGNDSVPIEFDVKNYSPFKDFSILINKRKVTLLQTDTPELIWEKMISALPKPKKTSFFKIFLFEAQAQSRNGLQQLIAFLTYLISGGPPIGSSEDVYQNAVIPECNSMIGELQAMAQRPIDQTRLEAFATSARLTNIIQIPSETKKLFFDCAKAMMKTAQGRVPVGASWLVSLQTAINTFDNPNGAATYRQAPQ